MTDIRGLVQFRPDHAYVPGRTPRHPEGAFDVVRATATIGMTPQALAQSAAFAAGIGMIGDGFYWEAHEVLEPVWMALPEGSRERRFVQGIIQVANGHLKLRMERPAATLRLAAIARVLVPAAGDGPVMGQDPANWQTRIDSLERAAKSEL